MYFNNIYKGLQKEHHSSQNNAIHPLLKFFFFRHFLLKALLVLIFTIRIHLQHYPLL